MNRLDAWLVSMLLGMALLCAILGAFLLLLTIIYKAEQPRGARGNAAQHRTLLHARANG